MQGTGDGHALPKCVRDERRNDETITTMGRVEAAQQSAHDVFTRTLGQFQGQRRAIQATCFGI